MKVAIYTPYLDIFGGGERYMMTIAQILSKYSVDILLDIHLYNLNLRALKKNLEERFNLNLSKIEFKKAPLGKNSNLIERLIFLSNYDLLFYLTDGSIFYPTAKKNILHIQSPLIGQPAKSLWGKIKLSGWDLIIYNSKFTLENSKNNWPKKSEVIYPPVKIDEIKPLEKKKYILSVGRFFGYLRDKKHQVLIETFKKISKNKKAKGWSLHLVGSASLGDQEYIDELKKIAKGFPINFYPNLKYDELIKLYGQSSIYWHALGFGETDPTKMEHFGISTVEAMAGGCVPVVIGQGGQTEIIEEGKSGLLWNNLDKLEKFTYTLINNAEFQKELASKARERAKKFSQEEFVEKINDLIK